MHRFVSSRSLVRAAVVAVALVVGLLPGVAWAGDGSGLPTAPSDPVGSVTGALGTVLGGTTGGQGSAPGAAAPNAAPAPGAAAQQADTGPSLPPPPPLDASQLDQLLAALGISKECSTAVQADLQKAIADLPATVQDIIQEIISQLPPPPVPIPIPITVTDPTTLSSVTMQQQGAGQAPTFSSPNPSELPTLKDLQQLVDDLQNKCQPKPPPAPGSPPPPQQQPVSAPQPEAPAPPPAQPVSYPGYAPTGARTPIAGITRRTGTIGPVAVGTPAAGAAAAGGAATGEVDEASAAGRWS